MRKLSLLLISLFISLSLVARADTEALENQLDDTIKSACHGYLPDMIPDAFSWLRSEIYKGSALCERADSDSEEQFDFYVKKIRHGGPKLDLSKRDNSDVQRAYECDNEYMCVEVRGRLYREGTPIAQKNYDRVSDHCKGRYGCIQEFFVGWPKPLPSTAEVSVSPPSGKGLKLADLMGRKKESSNSAPSDQPRKTGVQPVDRSSKPLGLAGLMSKSANRDKPTSVPSRNTNKLSLGSVIGERQRIAFEERLAEFEYEKASLGQLCSCSDNGSGCYDQSYQSVESHLATIHSQRSNVCDAAWNSGLTVTPQIQSDAEQKISAIKVRVEEIKQLDQNAISIIAGARQEEQAYQRQLARQEEKKNSIQWGKLAAMGVGALAGGVAGLDSETQIELIGAMMKDSMAGVEGASNVQSYTQQRVVSNQVRQQAISNSGSSAVSDSTSISGLTQQKTGDGSLVLACYYKSNGSCTEKTTNSQSAFESAKKRCLSYAGQVIDHCNIPSSVSVSVCTYVKNGVTTKAMHESNSGESMKRHKAHCESNGGSHSVR